MTKLTNSIVSSTSTSGAVKSKSLSQNKVLKAKSSSLNMPSPLSSVPSSTSSSASCPADLMAAAEMHELLAKLKDLVPTIPKNKKVSKLDIIQYVIDYIYDLEVTLESHPGAQAIMGFPTTLNQNFLVSSSAGSITPTSSPTSSPTSFPTSGSAVPASFSSTSSFRQPLSTISSS